MKRLPVIILLIILFLTVVGLILLKTTLVDENTSIPASPQAVNVKVELSNVKIGKSSDRFGKFTKNIEADLVIYNNSSQSIGLDPNYCDYKVYVNNQVLRGYDGCTEIGGVITVEPGDKYENKVSLYPPKVNKGDIIYVEYGYMILSPDNKGNGYNYDNQNNSYAKSNTTIVR